MSQIVVALNKMDDVAYSEQRFKEVKDLVEKMLKLVGYNTSKVQFIPVSAWKGDNLAKLSENTPWYKDPHLQNLLICLRLQRNQSGSLSEFQSKTCILSLALEQYPWAELKQALFGLTTK